jgi:hypothetical protein
MVEGKNWQKECVLTVISHLVTKMASMTCAIFRACEPKMPDTWNFSKLCLPDSLRSWHNIFTHFSDIPKVYPWYFKSYFTRKTVGSIHADQWALCRSANEHPSPQKGNPNLLRVNRSRLKIPPWDTHASYVNCIKAAAAAAAAEWLPWQPGHGWVSCSDLCRDSPQFQILKK